MDSEVVTLTLTQFTCDVTCARRLLADLVDLVRTNRRLFGSVVFQLKLSTLVQSAAKVRLPLGRVRFIYTFLILTCLKSPCLQVTEQGLHTFNLLILIFTYLRMFNGTCNNNLWKMSVFLKTLTASFKKEEVTSLLTFNMFPVSETHQHTSLHTHTVWSSAVCHPCSHLEDGVFFIRRWRVACSVFPGDLEEALFRVDPLETRKPATVHLRQKPRLQTDPPRLDAHVSSWNIMMTVH